MRYTIKGIEGVRNFIKMFSIEDIERRHDMEYLDFFTNQDMVIKEGKIVEGDEIVLGITEYTSYTKTKVETEMFFKVVRHDDFLLKLVKA